MNISLSRIAVVSVIATMILMKISDVWQLQWYKVAAIYFLGIMVMIFVTAEPKSTTKAAQVLEQMEKEITDALETQPQSPAEILEYIKSCKDYCRANNI